MNLPDFGEHENALLLLALSAVAMHGLLASGQLVYTDVDSDQMAETAVRHAQALLSQVKLTP